MQNNVFFSDSCRFRNCGPMLNWIVLKLTGRIWKSVPLHRYPSCRPLLSSRSRSHPSATWLYNLIHLPVPVLFNHFTFNEPKVLTTRTSSATNTINLQINIYILHRCTYYDTFNPHSDDFSLCYYFCFSMCVWVLMSLNCPVVYVDVERWYLSGTVTCHSVIWSY